MADRFDASAEDLLITADQIDTPKAPKATTTAETDPIALRVSASMAAL